MSDPANSTLRDWITQKVSAAKFLIVGTGAGAGTILALKSIDALERRPELAQQLVNGGALYVGFAMVALVIVDRRLSRAADLQARNVVAQEELARHVGELVDKDDQRAREQDLLLNHLATQNQEIIERLGAIQREQSRS